MRTRHQAAEEGTSNASEPTPSATNREIPRDAPGKAIVTKASRRTEPRTAKGAVKSAANNNNHSSGADEEQTPLDASGSASPETRATSKQAKTTKGKAASGKSHVGAPRSDTKKQQDEVQPRKRRKGGAVIASTSAEPDVAEGATAAAEGASVDAEALESNAALQVLTDKPGSAPLLAAEAEEAPHIEAREDDDEDEAPEEVCCASTHEICQRYYDQ